MNIVLGVTGGIAAYKAVLLARLFVEAGHELHVVPTADALRFVGLPTWEAISRNPVTVSVHDNVPEVRHVALGQRADLVVVAPATANTLAKMTAGLADDLLGTTLLATQAPVLVAPAMHTEMWQHASTQHNIAVLRERGVRFVGPESGRLTGDDSGPGRMSEPEQIFARALEVLAEARLGEDQGGPATPPATGGPGAGLRADLTGVRVLVTAGGTREPIDPVRYLGNRSSGRQGVAVVAAAAARGAQVTLLAANIEQAVLAELEQFGGAVTVVPVGSTAELQDAAGREAPGAQVIVMAAAVADFRVREVTEGKIRKEEHGDEAPVLQLEFNPDILRGLVEARERGELGGASADGVAGAGAGGAGAGRAPLIVGFAAETVTLDADAEAQHAELLTRGRRKLARKGCDLLAVNAVGWQQGFESDNNELLVIAAGGELVRQVSGTKRQAADALVDVIAGVIAESLG